MTVNHTLSPFWLNLGGQWVHLEGVSPGWSRSPSRPSSEFTSVGGHRHIQVARRVSREWSLNFQYATPEALAALQMAAEEPGPVLLYDETAAAANMLDPRDAAGVRQELPWLDCDGVPLRSLVDATSEPSDFTIDLVPTENITVDYLRNYMPSMGGFLNLSANYYHSALKFEVPSDLPPTHSASAELILRHNSPINNSLRIFRAVTDWVEGTGTVPAGVPWYEWPEHNPIPFEEVDFPGAPAEIRIPLPSGEGSAGTRSYLLDTDDYSHIIGIYDRHSYFAPIMRMSMTVYGRAHSFRQQVIPGRPYTLSFYTDAPAGTTVLTLDNVPYVSEAPVPGTPHRQYIHFTAAPDQTSIGVAALPGDWSGNWRTSGLQLTSGHTSSIRWMAGQRTPSLVSVTDADRLQVNTPHGSAGCDPYRGLSRDDWSLTVLEVS